MKHHSFDLLRHLLWFTLFVQMSDTCEPTISMHRDERHEGVGQNFTLSCNFFCIPPSYKLQWRKDNQTLSSITAGQSNFTLPLHVTGAIENDSGEYYCQTDPLLASSNNIFITVVDLIVNVSSEVAEVFEGEEVEFTCTAVSPLNASLFWTRGECEKNNHVSSHKTLLLSPARVQDSGDYHCCASIPTFTPLYRSKRVQVIVFGSGGALHQQLILYLMCKAGIFLLFVATAILFLVCRGRC